MNPRSIFASGMAAPLLAATLILGGCGQRPQPQRPPPDVGVVVVHTEAVPLTAVLPGRTDPFEVSDIRPQVTGILKARLFTEGALVRKGQALYQIDPAPYKATFDNATAVLAAAKSKATRYAQLAAQNAIAKQDYDDAEAAYKQALANVQSARINLDYTRITAPIGGRIGRSSVTIGALVTAQQAAALATIQTLDPIYVDITQSTAELLALKHAMLNGNVVDRNAAEAPATLTLEDGTTYSRTGRLQFSEVTVDQATGSVTLRAIFPNPDGVLLPGMFVRATVSEGVDNKAILAPQQGVSRNEKGEPTALVVDGNNMARLRTIATTRSVGNSWIVTRGLAPGDRLIVEGLQKALPDTQVHPVPATFAPASLVNGKAG